MNAAPPPWCADAPLLRSLPLPLRWWARYVRVARDPRTGAARGATALQRLAARLSKAGGGDGTAVVQVHDVRLAVDVSDLRLSEAIQELWAGVPELRILADAAGAGGTFLDVGGNYGTYTLRMAAAVGPAGRVLTFEPQPHLAALIRRSLDANAIRNVTVFEVGCSDAPGSVKFYRPANSGSASMHRNSAGTPLRSTITIRTDSLDRLLAAEALPGRLAIKLDVEGAEVATLRGAVQLLRARRPLIVFEINPDSLHAAGQTVADLVAALRDAGYERFSEVETYPHAQPIDTLRAFPQRNVVVH